MNVKKRVFEPRDFVTSYMAYFCGRVVVGPFAGTELRVFGVRKLKAFSEAYFVFLGDSPLYDHQIVIDSESMDVAFSDDITNSDLIGLIAYILRIKGATREMLGLTFIDIKSNDVRS